MKRILLVLLVIIGIGAYGQEQKKFEFSRFPQPSAFDPIAFKIITNDTVNITIVIEPLTEDLPVVRSLNLRLKPGEYIIPWDGLNNEAKVCSSGVYMCYYKIDIDPVFSKPIYFSHLK